MQLPDHFRIGRKGCRVVSEAVPNDFDTMFSKPTNVSAELNKRRVDVDAAHTPVAQHMAGSNTSSLLIASLTNLNRAAGNCVQFVMLAPLKIRSLTSVKSQTIKRHFFAC
jgi:hypothetical protein